MHSPAACASYTMCNVTEPLLKWTTVESYGAVAERCGALRKRYERVTERYGALWNRYGTLQSVVGRYRSVAEMLWGVAEHHRKLRSVAGRYRTLQNVTEPLRKISILPRNVLQRLRNAPQRFSNGSLTLRIVRMHSPVAHTHIVGLCIAIVQLSCLLVAT